MNKWVKIGLGAGATYLAYRTARTTLKKYNDVNTMMSDLVCHRNYDELRDMILSVLDMLTSTNKVENKKIEQTEHFTDAPKVEAKDESIAGAVKSVLDLPIVTEMIPDNKDVQMIKEVIDEAAEVEKLIRGWFK